jgi:hypothetical protein
VGLIQWYLCSLWYIPFPQNIFYHTLTFFPFFYCLWDFHIYSSSTYNTNIEEFIFV